jgi:two-component system, cell cycle response regulator
MGSYSGNILLTDDDPDLRRVLKKTLDALGFAVAESSNGEQALQQVKARPFEAVLLDVNMPGMGGIEACRRIRRLAPRLQILMLTVRDQEADKIEALDAGADDYITKPFDQHELQVRLRAGTRLVDLQAELLSAREALREQATKDSLTHLWNRSSILEHLARELSRAVREKGPVGVVMVDLDHFKSVNDTYGHLAGDAVLCEAARRMQNAMRPYDSIGRYGGEEFLILLPGCDEQASLSQAERMRKQLAQPSMSLNETSICVTASFGATAAIPGQSWTQEGLIRKADEALYLAKKLGRNRVEFLSFDSEPMMLLNNPKTEPIAR